MTDSQLLGLPSIFPSCEHIDRCFFYYNSYLVPALTNMPGFMTSARWQQLLLPRPLSMLSVAPATPYTGLSS